MENSNVTDVMLTPENVVGKLRHYVETLKSSAKEKPYPIDKDILMSFSFYMDFAINRANLVIVYKLHEIITAYLTRC